MPRRYSSRTFPFRLLDCLLVPSIEKPAIDGIGDHTFAVVRAIRRSHRKHESRRSGLLAPGKLHSRAYAVSPCASVQRLLNVPRGETRLWPTQAYGSVSLAPSALRTAGHNRRRILACRPRDRMRRGLRIATGGHAAWPAPSSSWELPASVTVRFPAGRLLHAPRRTRSRRQHDAGITFSSS